MTPLSRPAVPAEFDEYADGYDAGMGNPIKRLVGSSPVDFLRVKIRWLLADLGRAAGASPVELLDYGCGSGEFLAELAGTGLTNRLAGCDVSERMLAQAENRWTRSTTPEWFQPTDTELARREGRYDIITISAVLHHVERPDRPAVYANLRRLLKPGGRLYVFEHNPYNPVTNYVVKNTPIDRNAVLVPPPELRQGLKAAGFAAFRTRYLMFFPPRMTLLRPVESLIRRVPLGGQYVVRAEPGVTR